MIRLIDVHKAYETKYARLQVLKGVNLHVRRGEMVAVTGASGSGKSTLLNILGLLDKYDAGEYRIDGELMKNLSREEGAHYRNRLLGFVFQSANLIADKNIVENAALPLYYRGISRRERNRKAVEQLEALGLKGWERHFPNELSGGQKQRVAIARAIIANPPVILADEPTGQLDSNTSADVMALFREINRTGATIVVVTHEKAVADAADRIIHIKDGVVEA